MINPKKDAALYQQVKNWNESHFRWVYCTDVRPSAHPIRNHQWNKYLITERILCLPLYKSKHPQDTFNSEP